MHGCCFCSLLCTRADLLLRSSDAPTCKPTNVFNSVVQWWCMLVEMTGKMAVDSISIVLYGFTAKLKSRLS